MITQDLNKIFRTEHFEIIVNFSADKTWGCNESANVLVTSIEDYFHWHSKNTFLYDFKFMLRLSLRFRNVIPQPKLWLCYKTDRQERRRYLK
jgi:hypothetical protein